ncbi:MAG: response regulator [Deltaproteobacteria bacterium]|nr:MAG: response regulator [Deltaproteobacteria bacterium]
MNRLYDKLVLVVEDEPSMLDAMLKWLRGSRAGFGVMGCDRGDRALEVIDRHRPHLVISDVRLPGQSGIELLGLSLRKYPSMKFIIVSAYPTAKLEAQSLRLGAVRFFRKPLDLENLESQVVEVLSCHDAEAACGFVTGLSVAGMAQLLEAERQTTCVVVSAGRAEGKLWFDKGRLVHAVSGEKTGDDAALELLAARDARLSFEPLSESIQPTIENDLAFLLMEAARLEDEKQM